MALYDSFAPYYDDVVGERPELARVLRALALEYHPKARSLLELGCGSGSLLKVFSRHYDSTGIDISSKMIAKARLKASKATLHVADITRYRSTKKFDLVVCAFDTVNHLTSWSAWKAAFKNSAYNLATNGVFIFDLNTAYKLNRYVEEGEVAVSRPGITSTILVEQKSFNRYLVTVKCFSQVTSEKYRLHTTKISELVVPTKRVLQELRKYFSMITVIDLNRRRPSLSSEELFFVCRNA